MLRVTVTPLKFATALVATEGNIAAGTLSQSSSSLVATLSVTAFSIVQLFVNLVMVTSVVSERTFWNE